ncbi:polar amino acid transport system ATP-binding protein [Terrimicrobium sacchariphilum]|uniref:Polar amino acid transport system ATP-binding protein n=2 Tax=Terrimicrobium sacchariphilum TaxID=690879 RepID=A0A146G7Z8_TERSA|nr:polar amino acid transport system ATP-binding protein [Terrimicrobium sacchariphilum]
MFQKMYPTTRMENPSGPLLSVHGLHKSFDDNPILKGVSLDVEKGDLVSIIGPSGCGKSTFLRCMNFLEVPDAGKISIAGVEIDCQGLEDAPPRDLKEKAHKLRQHVGMVFQQFNLFPHKTILENTMLAPMVVRGVPREDAEKNGLRLLEKVGLGALADRYPAQMSGGQQQRAGIARALAMNPQVMLYDEPTSALDPELVDEVLKVMKDLDNEGMTQIVVTHEMRFARDASDYIVFMEKGHIVEISDEDEIFQNPKDERTRQFLKRFI